MDDMRAAVLGAGAWGTALAVILARSGRPTSLGVRRESHAKLLRESRENSAYLPGVELPENLEISTSWRDTAAQAGLIIMAIPSCFARNAMNTAASAIRPGAIVVSATKGVEAGSFKTMTAMLAEIVPVGVHLAVMSGPGFAVEIARRKPAALVVAAGEDKIARAVQQIFAIRRFRVYRSSDVIGVEIAGAAKNVLAIAAGISDGLMLGSSARAALITRGLAELTRLVTALGGHRETVTGLAGLGDLVLTCTGELSRNRALGMRLAQLGNPPDLLKHREGESVAEGVVNARVIVEMAKRCGIEMPIASAVYRTLYDGEAPQAMVEELLSRELKAEF